MLIIKFGVFVDSQGRAMSTVGALQITIFHETEQNSPCASVELSCSHNTHSSIVISQQEHPLVLLLTLTARSAVLLQARTLTSTDMVGCPAVRATWL